MKLGFEARNAPFLTGDDWERIDALGSTIIKLRSYHCIPDTISGVVARNLSVILRPSSDGDINPADRYFEMGEALTKLLDAGVPEIILCCDSEPNLHDRPMPADYWSRVATFFVLIDRQFGQYTESGRLKYASPPMAVAQGDEAWLEAATVVRRSGMNEGATENLLTGFDFYGGHFYGQQDTSLVQRGIDLAATYAPGVPIIAAEVGDASNADPSAKTEAIIQYLTLLQQAGAYAACLFIVGSHDPQWSGFVLPVEQIRRIGAAMTPHETPQVTPHEASLADRVLSQWPGPITTPAKPLVWEQWEGLVRRAAQIQPHLQPNELAMVALGPLATLDQESGGKVRADGDQRKSDGYYCSRGLFQINTCGGAGSAIMREYGLTNPDDLYDLKWQYLHAEKLLLATEEALYWARKQGVPYWPGRALQGVQRSSSDPNGHGYQAAYARLATELGLEVQPMGTTMRIGNLDVPDLRERYPSAYAHRPLSAITNIGIHHSATDTLSVNATEDQELAALDSIHRYHATVYRGIAYPMCVFPSGRIYLTGAWDTIRYLVGGDGNITTLGLLMHGDFSDTPPGDTQLDAAHRLIANIRYQMGNAALPVVGHRDLSSTQCPGNTWPRWKDRLTKAPEPVDTRTPLHIQLDVLYGHISHVTDEALRQQMFEALFAAKDAAGIK